MEDKINVYNYWSSKMALKLTKKKKTAASAVQNDDKDPHLLMGHALEM